MPLTSFLCRAALSKTHTLAVDHDTTLPDGNPAAMLVRRESGLALVPAFAHIATKLPDSSKQPLASLPSLMTLAEPPKHKELAPAPPAAPPVPGQPGIENWGPTEAPAADHTWLICIIVGFVAVAIVAALIPLCVRRDSSHSGKEAPDGSSRKRAKGSYGSKRKERKDGSSSEWEEEFRHGGNEDDRIEPKGYGSKRKERKEASGASSGRVDTAKDKTEQVPDSQIDVHVEARNETSESRPKGNSYRQARATRKEHRATSSEAPKVDEVSGEESMPSNLQAPLLASNLLDEEAQSPTALAPARTYKQDRASRKAQAAAVSSQTTSGSSPTQEHLGSTQVRSDVTEEKMTTASSRYGKDRASRKAKALEESR